ncbi:ribosome biogenesis GTPase Der [Polynucleobacter sphagniphilus]|jgi:GTP-binding protein|uniref:GTPase Der n=1 Tax=Polynucleobacter sphagniphilus TaxID=1743169 RepID=A0AA43S593_9BURK|nr:ribosome biogenesis GTPase Der [Polynucleobacter sphagniphilus]MDH6155795.1 GTP-binding protein [Polynucleobacter sphagniphilus]MDH6249935.1 GTP-binding protein [Polynucleobacter sphagniphilus]MDH6299437.1 GTP-binding protein [Polynucleobacter sphagniphilus]MDH6302692.1 GTP-binding protein [Polynucleobacter sphagniphilus]MDH6420136.1 GTP-binding protein [Polynucleobacter sphagniphilus]
MNPVITIVGRPNVGKSTLFNRLTRSRDALVADFSGLTRDRHYGKGRIGERAFICVDTGGFEPVAKTGIVAEMAKQTKQAVAESDIIIFLVDGRLGMAPQDRVIADFLRKAGRPVILAVNKTEGMQAGVVTADFHELGLGEPFPISSAHGDGVRGLIDDALDSLGIAEPEPEDLQSDPNRPMKIAVVGRPNVGKSTLINKLIGEERVIAFDMPGTTRDAIEVPFERNGKPYILIDTAGLRRRGKVFEAIEKFSVVKTLQAIADCNVVILMLDAQQDISEQDAHIAGFIVEAGRALVVAVNKWDGIDSYVKERARLEIAQKLRFLDFANVHPISAKKGTGLKELFKDVDSAYAAAMAKLPTPKLTRILQEAIEHQQPKRVGMGRPKLRYAHQGGMNPPIVVIHGTSLSGVTDSYKRYLEGRFRDVFKLRGTPLRIQMNTAKNPYVDSDPKKGKKK